MAIKWSRKVTQLMILLMWKYSLKTDGQMEKKDRGLYCSMLFPMLLSMLLLMIHCWICHHKCILLSSIFKLKTHRLYIFMIFGMSQWFAIVTHIYGLYYFVHSHSLFSRAYFLTWIQFFFVLLCKKLYIDLFETHAYSKHVK